MIRIGIEPKADGFRRELASAKARGDVGMARCMAVELQRMGDRPLEVADPPPAEKVVPALRETTDPAPLERAVPSRGGRPKMPRCEHGQIAARCVECNDDLAA